MINERKLESYVEMQFGTNLYEFIKQKVEVDRLYDYEIASLLGVSDSMIRRLRNTYRIKRANGFSRRFDRRYGKEAIERFKKMVEDPSYTLDEVGRQFGFSKENARQVYQKIYGSPYTEAYKRKRLVKKKKGLVGRTKRSKQFGDLVNVSKRMEPTVLAEENILAQIMTTKELAKYLRLHEITILKNAAKGIIPGIRIGNRWRFDKEAIDQWIAEGQNEPPAEKKPKTTPVSESEKKQMPKKEKSKRRR